MKNLKTEFVDINELLAQEKIRTIEPLEEKEINAEDVLKKIIKEEEVVAEVEEEVVEKTPTPEPPKTTVGQTPTDKLKSIIDAGFIKDVQITWGEGEDAKEVFLSELSDLDDDQYNAIIAKYKEATENELKEKYISKDGLDKRTLEYVNLKKAGGDPTALIQEEIQYVNPWEKLDLDDEQVQEYIVRTALQAQGLKAKFIDQEIEELIKNNELDLEATKVFKNVQKQFDEKIENEKKAQLDRIEQDKVAQKEFRKSLSTQLKTLIDNEDVAKVILDNATKKDELGLTNTDKIYFDLQKDPEKFAEFAFFLNNKEEFYKVLGVKAKNKETIKTIKTLFTINPQVVKTEKTKQIPKDQEAGDKVLEHLTNKFKQ